MADKTRPTEANRPYADEYTRQSFTFRGMKSWQVWSYSIAIIVLALLVLFWLFAYGAGLGGGPYLIALRKRAGAGFLQFASIAPQTRSAFDLFAHGSRRRLELSPSLP